MIDNPHGFREMRIGERSVAPAVTTSAYVFNNPLLENTEMRQHLLGWVRDKKGKVIHRPYLENANCVTTMAGGGHYDEFGMGNTTMYILEEYE